MKQSFPGAGWSSSGPAVALLLAVALPAAFLLGLAPEWQFALRYERSAVVDANEWWRLITGQWLHVGWRHGAVNLAAWLLLCHLLVPWLGVGRVSLVLAGGVAGTAAGLLWHAELAWYVGLSGALHGVLAGAMAASWRQMPRLATLVLVVLVGKLLAEQMLGDGLAGRLAADARVVTEAHIWGALGGLLVGGALVLFSRRAACV
ncbi:MAG: rhombosortase [Pseudomonadales bacterium]|nr:rhombosortase [Pseudomonadales bacterium]